MAILNKMVIVKVSLERRLQRGEGFGCVTVCGKNISAGILSQDKVPKAGPCVVWSRESLWLEQREAREGHPSLPSSSRGSQEVQEQFARGSHEMKSEDNESLAIEFC